MAMIAIDVVLLPPKRVMDKAIALNRLLQRTTPGEIRLSSKPDKTHGLAHLSVAMGCIESKQLPRIRKQLSQIAKQFDPLQLSVTGIKIEKRRNGQQIPYFTIKRTRLLQALHETLMRSLPRSSCASISSRNFYAKNANPLSVRWVKNYARKASFSRFNPHITLGIGRFHRQPFRFPIHFVASRLAVCHLGDYCTCRKVLFSVHLKK